MADFRGRQAGGGGSRGIARRAAPGWQPRRRQVAGVLGADLYAIAAQG